MPLRLFGIANCDTCRKARKWFEENALPCEFHDLREQGIDMAMLQRWAAAMDWQTLLNTRSRTWRELSATKRDITCESNALDLMLEHPTLIKRPVIEGDGFIEVGFTDRQRQAILDRLG